MLSWIRGYVIAVLVGAALGSFASTAFVLSGLAALRGPIPLDASATMALNDLAGLGPTYAAVLAVPLAVLFGIAGFAARSLPAARLPLLALAGGLAFAGVLYGLTAVVGTQVIAGAREPAGFAAQVVAGLLTGLVFALAHRPRPKATRAAAEA
ncbi:MAG: hypothetical protein KJS97_13510 [Alphaproteobacteria bacterium]|nr:hypothetical protein [Alphaproteobacteria bacterium]